MKQLKFCENWENVATIKWLVFLQYIPAWELGPIKRTEFEKLNHDFVITDNAKFFVMFQCPFSVPKLIWIEFHICENSSSIGSHSASPSSKTMCAFVASLRTFPRPFFLNVRTRRKTQSFRKLPWRIINGDVVIDKSRSSVETTSFYACVFKRGPSTSAWPWVAPPPLFA